jgi:hypothetical protein
MEKLTLCIKEKDERAVVDIFFKKNSGNTNHKHTGMEKQSNNERSHTVCPI